MLAESSPGLLLEVRDLGASGVWKTSDEAFLSACLLPRCTGGAGSPGSLVNKLTEVLPPGGARTLRRKNNEDGVMSNQHHLYTKHGCEII